MDTTNIKLRKLLNACRACKSPDLDVVSIAEFIDLREKFAKNYQATFKESLEKKESPDADALKAARDLRDLAVRLEADFDGEIKSFNMLALYDVIVEIHEALDSVLNAYYLAGLSPLGQFNTRDDFSWYTVPGDFTIQDVALKFYGSRDAYSEILKANPTLDQESIKLKTIKLPGIKLGQLDPSTYYGVDIDCSLPYVDEDLKVLEPLDSVVQALTNTCKFGSAETPEFPNFGNPYIDMLGTTGANQAAASSKLLDSIYLDPAVESASIQTLSLEEDAIKAELQVKLVGSNETISIKS